MTQLEFKLIKNFFMRQTLHRQDVILGIGDDCAIIQMPPNQQMALTTDSLVAGVHFPLITSAYDIGFKSLAVNLSDLAAMGATPAWFTLALTLPEVNEPWITDFCSGLFQLANRYNVQLIGGDLTQGPLTITIQAHGLLPKDHALKRSTANPNDLIYVAHTLGDAAAGLALLKQNIKHPTQSQTLLIDRLNRPEPQVEIGKQLLNFATAAIDISDGLAADLGHILEESKLGAKINVDAIPLSDAILNSFSKESAIEFALNGGDDYVLCFTIPPEKQAELNSSSFTCIGSMVIKPGLDLHYQSGEKYEGKTQGYQHFR